MQMFILNNILGAKLHEKASVYLSQDGLHYQKEDDLITRIVKTSDYRANVTTLPKLGEQEMSLMAKCYISDEDYEKLTTLWPIE